MKNQTPMNATLLATVAVLALNCITANAQLLEAALSKAREGGKIQSGTFWSVQRPLFPPMPINPFPDRALLESKDGRFFYDDRDVDYKQWEAEAAAEAAKNPQQASLPGNGPGGGGNNFMEGSGNDLRLCIELLDGNVKRMSFNTVSAMVYYVEESTNLVDWTLLQQIVANDTNGAFFSYDSEARFYRIRQGDERLQFPYWDDFVEQRLYFAMWTPLTGGTYHLEHYIDGNLDFQASVPVNPTNGFLLLYDADYNPSDWPNYGYYQFNDWELRVTLDPPSGQNLNPADPVEVTVNKKSRRRNYTRSGITVQQYNVFTVALVVQEEIDEWMRLYFLACYQAAYQYNLDNSLLNEFISSAAVPRLTSTNSWNELKDRLYSTNGQYLLSDLHYFGHGGRTLIGSNHVNARITLKEMVASLLKTNPMVYVALDGCRTSKEPDLLKILVGHTKKVAKMDFRERGFTPRFGWGWTDGKAIGFALQGALYDPHFEFVGDYYYYLIQRDISGYLYHTYEEAINFAKHPNGGSPYVPSRIDNSEGNSINYVGCFDCYFDD